MGCLVTPTIYPASCDCMHSKWDNTFISLPSFMHLKWACASARLCGSGSIWGWVFPVPDVMDELVSMQNSHPGEHCFPSEAGSLAIAWTLIAKWKMRGRELTVPLHTEELPALITAFSSLLLSCAKIPVLPLEESHLMKSLFSHKSCVRASPHPKDLRVASIWQARAAGNHCRRLLPHCETEAGFSAPRGTWEVTRSY